MKAVVLREHGAGGLRYETDFPDPVAGVGDVVLRVRAASLNYHDVFTRRGMPGIRIAMPAIMGLDVAGEIAAVDPGVSGWNVGDRVLGDPINRVEGGADRRDGARRTGRVLPAQGAPARRDPRRHRL
jgi:alcohol dehydrogenase